MGQFGAKLKSERETRGIRLEDIAEKTRISVRLLDALESERFDLLPGGVFNVSFIRQYCRCVGLDEDVVVAEFRTLTLPTQYHVTEQAQFVDAPDLIHRHGATLAESLTKYLRRYGLVTAVVCAIALIAMLIALWWLGSGSRPAPASSSLRDSSAKSEVPKSQVVRLDNDVTQHLHVEIKITAKVWIQAVADGERVFENILNPGETRSIVADDSVRLVVGNAGGITLAVNGKIMPPIGSSGHVRRVTLTSSGMKIDRIEPNRPPDPNTASEKFLDTHTL